MQAIGHCVGLLTGIHRCIRQPQGSAERWRPGRSLAEHSCGRRLSPEVGCNAGSGAQQPAQRCCGIGDRLLRSHGVLRAALHHPPCAAARVLVAVLPHGGGGALGDLLVQLSEGARSVRHRPVLPAGSATWALELCLVLGTSLLLSHPHCCCRKRKAGVLGATGQTNIRKPDKTGCSLVPCVLLHVPQVWPAARRVQAAELGKIFVTKANRLSFQRIVSRRTQQALTSVELDFVFPPACSLQAQCDALLRSPSNMGRTPNMSWYTCLLLCLLHSDNGQPRCTPGSDCGLSGRCCLKSSMDACMNLYQTAIELSKCSRICSLLMHAVEHMGVGSAHRGISWTWPWSTGNYDIAKSS